MSNHFEGAIISLSVQAKLAKSDKGNSAPDSSGNPFFFFFQKEKRLEQIAG